MPPSLCWLRVIREAWVTVADGDEPVLRPDPGSLDSMLSNCSHCDTARGWRRVEVAADFEVRGSSWARQMAVNPRGEHGDGERHSRLMLSRENGDSANNDEHLAIREQEAVLAVRLARLENILRGRMSSRATLSTTPRGSAPVSAGRIYRAPPSAST